MSTRRAELVGQVGDVLWDLPTFLTAPLYRRWHLHWGATIGEVHAPLPGDALLSRAHFRATRAITIDAPPEAVWPWLVLTPTDNHQTRLVTRIHASYDWSHPFSAAFGVVLTEFGDFAMLRRMLRGIKARAESSSSAT